MKSILGLFVLAGLAASSLAFSFSSSSAASACRSPLAAAAALGNGAPTQQQRSSSSSTTQLAASFFNFGNKSAEEPKEAFPPVIIDKDFRLAAIFLVAGLVLDLIPYIQLTLGPIVTLLGLLFLVQTIRLSFVCDTTAFELKTGKEPMEDNIVVGGRNRWDYDKFVNYEFFPKDWIDAPQGPILVYFKETQTPSEFWSTGPGEQANSEEALKKGAKVREVLAFNSSFTYVYSESSYVFTHASYNLILLFNICSLAKCTSFRPW
jgi:hypothetical protein